MTSTYRVGMIVPSSNTTMETEIPAMFRAREAVRPDDRFTFHSSRLRLKHVTAEELRAMNSEVGRAAAELADLRPDVVATACLVAIMAQGADYHCAAEAEITQALRAEGAEAPVASSAGALIAALQSLGARRIAMITPYMKPLTQLVADYVEAAGIEVQDAISLEVSDNRAVAQLDPARLPGHARSLNLEGCDALVLSACVQMPSLAAIELAEREFGLPTLSAATATAWSILRALGVEPTVPGAGGLLSRGDLRPLGTAG